MSCACWAKTCVVRACKVGQVCCREDLNRVGAQVIARILKLLKDRRVGFSVSVENVPEDCGQLVDLLGADAVPTLAAVESSSSIFEFGVDSWLSSGRSALSDGCW